MPEPLTKEKLLEKASPKPLTKEEIITLAQYVGLFAPEKIDVVTLEDLKSALEEFENNLDDNRLTHNKVKELLEKAFPAIYEKEMKE